MSPHTDVPLPLYQSALSSGRVVCPSFSQSIWHRISRVRLVPGNTQLSFFCCIWSAYWANVCLISQIGKEWLLITLINGHRRRTETSTLYAGFKPVILAFNVAWICLHLKPFCRFGCVVLIVKYGVVVVKVLKPVLRCAIVRLGVRYGSRDSNANCDRH